MRIWDINPGYLNDKSLLGEHRELHGIVSILTNNKKGYSRHPETMRWQGYGWALSRRHALLRAEMRFRGFVDRTPVEEDEAEGDWPSRFIDPPAGQFDLLAEKYREKPQGRIPLPTSARQLWDQHKHSVLARDRKAYRNLGRVLAEATGNDRFPEAADTVIRLLRLPPAAGDLQNALQQMWGLVADGRPDADLQDSRALLTAIQDRARERGIVSLCRSTAICELQAWL